MSVFYKSSTTSYSFTKAGIDSKQSREILLPIKEKHTVILIYNVVLVQDPTEKLNLEAYFLPIKNDEGFLNKFVKNGTNLYEVKMQLNFLDNLGEFDQPYVYEIICERSQGETTPAEHLFTVYEKRVSNSSSGIVQRFKIPYFYLNLNNPLCFYVHRHNLDFFIRNINRSVEFKWLSQEVPDNVKLLVKGEIIPAHKFVLTYKSEVFKNMFSNEIVNAEDNVVKIDDFNVDVIKEMVNFIYTGEENNIKEMRYQLLEAAYKYKLCDLRDCCIEHITNNSACDNIAETLRLANFYDIRELKDCALNFAKNHQEELSKEPTYQNYLCLTMHVDNVVDVLLFAKWYNIERVSQEALDFIGQNFFEMKDNAKFYELFESHPKLMKEIVLYYFENYVVDISN